MAYPPGTEVHRSGPEVERRNKPRTCARAVRPSGVAAGGTKDEWGNRVTRVRTGRGALRRGRGRAEDPDVAQAGRERTPTACLRHDDLSHGANEPLALVELLGTLATAIGQRLDSSPS